MKKIFLLFALILVFTSCEDAGVTHLRLNGDVNNLPPELKDLKVYSVSLGGGDWVKVGIINNNVNSMTYAVGKTIESVIIINNGSTAKRVINAKQIISENDSIIVIRK